MVDEETIIQDGGLWRKKRLGTPDLGYMFWQLTEEKSKSQHFTRVFSEQIRENISNLFLFRWFKYSDTI